MVSPRAYRSARSAPAALEELESQAGRQFCPRCVAAFRRVAAEGRLEAMEQRGPVVAGV
jgi:HD-GYP domain-containing protein (c-di-GMP phosphodiesterase class II)